MGVKIMLDSSLAKQLMLVQLHSGQWLHAVCKDSTTRTDAYLVSMYRWLAAPAIEVQLRGAEASLERVRSLSRTQIQHVLRTSQSVP